MDAPRIKRVVPNENWRLVIQFDPEEYRLFESRIAREEMNWPQLAYPNKFKNFTHTERGVIWSGMGELSADYLYRHSQPLAREKLEGQVLRLSYKNQAPTDVHPTHHVYGVYLFPFRTALFDVGESIAGGHAEMGGSKRYTVDELLAWPEWKRNFQLAGGEWAIPIIESHERDGADLSDVLVREICRREGLPSTYA